MPQAPNHGETSSRGNTQHTPQAKKASGSITLKTCIDTVARQANTVARQANSSGLNHRVLTLETENVQRGMHPGL